MKRAWEDNCGKPVLEGRYANHIQIGVNDSEFVLDFGQFYPEAEEPRFHTRIILAPRYARALLETLMGALEQFEVLSQGATTPQ